MGVAFSHGDARWSYTGFNNMRCRLGEMHGLKIVPMSDTFKYPDYTHLHKGNFIREFLELSDCDAVLTPEWCRIFFPWLKVCASNMSYDECPLYGDYDRRMLFSMAQGMEMAVFLNEDFKWC